MKYVIGSCVALTVLAGSLGAGYLSGASARDSTCHAHWKTQGRVAIVDQTTLQRLGYVETSSDGCGKIRGKLKARLDNEDLQLQVEIIDSTGTQLVSVAGNAASIKTVGISTQGRPLSIRGTIISASAHLSGREVGPSTTGISKNRSSPWIR